MFLVTSGVDPMSTIFSWVVQVKPPHASPNTPSTIRITPRRFLHSCPSTAVVRVCVLKRSMPLETAPDSLPEHFFDLPDLFFNFAGIAFGFTLSL